jgi:hypothetical protein
MLRDRRVEPLDHTAWANERRDDRDPDGAANSMF